MEEQIEAVQRMQDYIECHLYESITLTDLSRVSLYSPWYSYRIFSRRTGLTPADYIRRLRLSRSALRLRDESVKVTDIAFEAGFDSVEGYQRAFLREFGRNPSEYALHPVPLFLFHPYGVKFSAITGKEKQMGNEKTVFVRLEEKPQRKALVKRGVHAADYWAYCEEVGCDVWGLLTSIKALGGEPVCLWLPRAYMAPGTSEYVQGVEVPEDYAGTVPEGFDVILLPACSYLVFQGEPFAEEDYCAAIEQVQAAVHRFQPEEMGCVWDDENPRIQLEPIGTRGYVELYPVRPMQKKI